MWAIGFGIFVLGLIFVIVAPINKRKNARCSMQTQGQLKEIRRASRSRFDNASSSSYIYSYVVDGIEYQIRSTILSQEAKKTGDACTIWYNPNKPKEAQPFRYESAKIYNILIVIGIVMILLGFILTVLGIQ